MPDDEHRLLERLAEGDERALKEIFYAHFSTLTAIGTRITGDSPTGKDVAQRVIIALWEKRASLEIEGQLLPYLKRMAINEALAHQRTAGRRRERLAERPGAPEATDPDGETNMEAEDIKAIANRAITALPPKCRDVFKLSRFEQLTYREIGETLGISVKTVEKHMGRALRELREALGSYLNTLF